MLTRVDFKRKRSHEFFLTRDSVARTYGSRATSKLHFLIFFSSQCKTVICLSAHHFYFVSICFFVISHRGQVLILLHNLKHITIYVFLEFWRPLFSLFLTWEENSSHEHRMSDP